MSAAPKPPFRAYSGDQPYVFVSYSHDDADAVYPELDWLRAAGVQIWYDEGISPGQSWPEELAGAIQNCSVFLLFVTGRSVASEHCEREVTFALGIHKPLLAVHLEEARLTPGLALSIGNRQAILRHRETQGAYRDKVLTTLTALQADTPTDGPHASTRRARSTRTRALTAGVALTAMVAAGYLVLRQSDDEARRAWARDTAIPRIIELAKDERYDQAFDLAVEVEHIVPEDAVLAELWPRFSARVTSATQPAGARVYAKPYLEPEAPWRFVGTTPLKARVPLGAKRWRLDKGGYQPRMLATPLAGILPPGAPPIELMREDKLAPRMVGIPAAPTIVPYAGFPRQDTIAVSEFQIGRFEVTNREFQEFIDAGGYDNPEHWQGFEFRDAERELSFEQARERFLDRTGRPGPATWELGRFPDRSGDHPVSGISWYEAAAYARFRGGALPTLYHWNLVTHGPSALTLSTPLAALMLSLANIGGGQPQPVGQSHSMGVFGTFDNAGNVREWMWNEGAPDKRWILGGAASDVDYAFTHPNELPAFDRSPENGMRLMISGDVDAQGLGDAVSVVTRDYRSVEPVSDEGFAVLRAQFSYDRAAVTTKPIDRTTIGRVTWERIAIEPARGPAFELHLVIPNDARPPLRAVIYFPARSMFLSTNNCVERLRSQINPDIPMILAPKTVPDTGRMLVMPVWTGVCERYDGFYEASPETQLQLRAAHIRAWYEELARTLDYLDGRADVVSTGYGYFGWSYGGSRPLPLLALESRLTAAVLLSGGFPHGDWPQIADEVNYVRRTTLPVLMLGGRFDAYRPVVTAQRPLFDLLATPPEHKRMVVFESGHFPLPRAETLREVADWLDRYLPTTGQPGN